MGYKHNEEDILKVGYEVIRKNGYHKIGVNAILKEAKIPKGSFYNFFNSKEEFVRKVIVQYGTTNATWLEKYFNEVQGNPIQVLEDFYNLLIYYNEIDHYQSGCLLNLLSNEIGRMNDTLAAEINNQFYSWMQIIAAYIQRGQNSGDITREMTALDIAEYLHAGLYGTFPRMKVNRSRKQMDLWAKMAIQSIRA